MKKFLLLWVIGLAMLAGCAEQGLSQSELFEKKKECVSYQAKIEQDIYEEYGDESDRLVLKLEEIFYSHKKNSCLYIVYAIQQGFETSHVYDYFTKEDIAGYNIIFDSNKDLTTEELYLNDSKKLEFSQKVEELK